MKRQPLTSAVVVAAAGLLASGAVSAAMVEGDSSSFDAAASFDLLGTDLSASAMQPEAAGNVIGPNAFLGTADVGSFAVGPGDFQVEPMVVPQVPLPASIWLLGSALLGLLGIGRRRRAG
jgi:hypothetical protein